MNLVYRIAFISIALVLLFATLSARSGAEFGLIVFVFGFFGVLLGLVLLIFKRVWGQGLLLAAGILLLLGFVVCSSTPSMLMH